MYRIKEIRESKGISISELSRMTGLSRTTIYGLENGIYSDSTTKTLLKLAHALGVKVGDLFSHD